MHIILTVLTLLGTFFWVYRRFHESGLSISSINPFLWKRRHDWNKRRATNPLFILDNNKDVAAALMFVIAKLDGEMTRDSKMALLNDYQTLLRMDESEATATIQQTSFMLEQYPIILSDVSKILHTERVNAFSSEQIDKLMSHLPQIAAREGDITIEQKSWIDAINQCFSKGQSKTF